ncbi:transcriptional regulator [marine bacterium AO1-C]|nr:transcriptional regulator [marine bacterium AO1-C]
MTTMDTSSENCPAQKLLKALSGKWKPQIFKMAASKPIRFNQLLRDLEGANKQTLATALREMVVQDILVKEVVQEKPLHIEYTLSEKGKSLIGVFVTLEQLSDKEY